MRFHCTTAQYLPGDVYVEANTVIGDGTKWPIPENWEDEDGWKPSLSMVPLDDDAKAFVEEWNEERGARVDPLGPEAFPATRTTARRAGDQKTPNPNKDMAPKDADADNSLTTRRVDTAESKAKPPAPPAPAPTKK